MKRGRVRRSRAFPTTPFPASPGEQQLEPIVIGGAHSQGERKVFINNVLNNNKTRF